MSTSGCGAADVQPRGKAIELRTFIFVKAFDIYTVKLLFRKLAFRSTPARKI